MGLPAAVECVNPAGVSDYVLTCEHASNFIPNRYGKLGLNDADLQRHIAWDIGAANVARRLSALIDAPLFLSGYSRLLIDCNRPLGSATSIPSISESTEIPGNRSISAEDAVERAKLFHAPFQTAVSTHLNQRAASGRKAIVVGIHSFTPIFKGFVRPWHAGILFRKAERFGLGLVKALGTEALNVAANEPYTIDDESDYTVPVHGEQRGLDAVLVEIRQDLVAEDAGAEDWAQHLARALRLA